jgi:hypothetical protein
MARLSGINIQWSFLTVKCFVDLIDQATNSSLADVKRLIDRSPEPS